MCVEIEAKLKVDSLEQVGRKLTELGAEFVEERLEKDSYFDTAKSQLTKSDRCLRIRRQTAGEKEKLFLTYKGAREKDKYKRRTEIEIEIADGNSAEKLLSALGYEKVLVFEKKRQVWRIGVCEVLLDELPLLGKFIEIEGPDAEKISDIQSKLGLADLTHIKESYATLVADKLGRKNFEANL